MHDLPTPCILIDADKVRRNLRRMADYATQHNLKLRPHTKTHKSLRIARMQLDGEGRDAGGAWGLTVAKVGEAATMAEACGELLMAYPAVDPRRCAELAKLARGRTLRVAIDSAAAADALSAAAAQADVNIGILVDVDVGMHRTGVQSPQAARALAEHVDAAPGLSLDGIMFYPGHIGCRADDQTPLLRAVDAILTETLGLWEQAGLPAGIVSGGSTPTAFQSHHVTRMTEMRPGTYVYNDMNCVRGGFVTLDDCAARIVATVVSDAVPGQVVLDAGTKTLTSDRCGPAPDSGHGYICEYPEAKITKLTEEHGQVDITACGRKPRVGEQVTVIPNHICPCVNLQDRVYWLEPGGTPEPMPIDARGRVF